MCNEPNAIAVATCDSQSHPSVRMVLLKGYDDRGFSFYTNYSSRKGQELAANGHAAFCIWWEGLQRQVRLQQRLPSVAAVSGPSAATALYVVWYSLCSVCDIISSALMVTYPDCFYTTVLLYRVGWGAHVGMHGTMDVCCLGHTVVL